MTMTMTKPRNSRPRTSAPRRRNEPNEIVLIDSDHRLLKELVGEYRGSWRTYAPYLHAVGRELDRAQIVSPEEAPDDLVRLGSHVRLRDLRHDMEMIYTLVLPDEANIDDQRLSVLAPLGTAILGTRVGDVIRWPVPAGIRTLRVEEILPQRDDAI